MWKFIVKETNTGVKFDLKAPGDETVITSEVYSSKKSCLAGIESVKKNALIAKYDDLTVEGDKVTNPKFELYEDKAGAYRFRLKARNGENIAASEAFKTKDACLKGIEGVRKNAADA